MDRAFGSGGIGRGEGVLRGGEQAPIIGVTFGKWDNGKA